MGLLSQIHQISQSGSRDQLNSLLFTEANSAYVPSLYMQRSALSSIRHDAELSLAAFYPIVRTGK
ncbi:MAG: hypothetical protein Q4D42_04455 [Eubacteriales bacterium]|nr:hypothetical protein [Eubacteriales bacterium]